MLSKHHPVVHRSVSEKVGVIRHIHKLKIRNNDPRIFCFYAEAANSTAFGEFLAGDRNSGAGLTEEAALMATIGEFFERYCSSFVQQVLTLSTWESLPTQATDPSRFALFSTDQYKITNFQFTPFTSESSVAWLPANSMCSDELVYVPAQMVYMPYRALAGEQAIAPQISHGLACHTTKIQAMLSALFELVERDAFSIFWLTKKNSPSVVVSSDTRCLHTEKIRSTVGERFFVPGIRYSVFDITSDLGIPTFFVISSSVENGSSVITVGAASRINPDDALRKAFLEASQARPYIRHIRSTDPDWEPAENFSNIRTFDEHARVYSYRPDILDGIEFIRPNDDPDFNLGKYDKYHHALPTNKQLKIVVEILRSSGFDPVYIDLTTPDARDVGLSVVRAIVPGLHQLHGDHLIPFLGGSRLPETFRNSSNEDQGNAQQMPNYYPHPFP